MFYLGQVGSGALQRRVRDESITAYLCCQVDDNRSFGLYLLSWKLATKTAAEMWRREATVLTTGAEIC